MAIYDENDTIVTNRVQSALSRPDVIEIKNRTLDGGFHIQNIGSGATVLDVVAHFTMDEKLVFDTVKKTGAIIKVIFDGRYYTGMISGEPSYNRIASYAGPIFTISFLLLVKTEGVT